MGAYGSDGMSSALEERLQGITDLTTRQENEVERRLENMAENEIGKAAQPFRDWIAESEHGPAIAIAVLYWPPVKRPDGSWVSIEERMDQRADNHHEAIKRMTADYIAYRVNTFTDDERAEVVREVMG